MFSFFPQLVWSEVSSSPSPSPHHTPGMEIREWSILPNPLVSKKLRSLQSRGYNLTKLHRSSLGTKFRSYNLTYDRNPIPRHIVPYTLGTGILKPMRQALHTRAHRTAPGNTGQSQVLPPQCRRVTITIGTHTVTTPQ